MSKFCIEIADNTDPYNRWLDDGDVKVSISHNGYQFSAITCSKAEWRQVIEKLAPKVADS